MRELKLAIKMTLLFAVFSGIVFPALIWLAAQTFFPFQANGSFIKNKDGKIVGSSLIGQNFVSEKYFHPRPSAAGVGYDASNSSGTNLGPTSTKLVLGVKDDPATANLDESFAGINELAVKYRTENLLASDQKLPADAVTRSASGLDPDISPANAELQIERVARARGLATARVARIVKQNVEGRFLGIFGEARVNVLKLNLALDELH